MSAAIVFQGPTIERSETVKYLDAQCQPPARQGDIYRAALTRPRAIGLIDGYFNSVPSPWHKEILWALSEGIPVYGAASLGALRAAELSVFGMIGVGRIFEAFRDGELTDDDEVAVVHASEEDNYRRMSEPMVNIRYTLEAALRANVVSEQTIRVTLEAAKGTFYSERTYPRCLEAASAAGAPAAEVETLRKWLNESALDQKKLDAVAMLRVMADDISIGARVNPRPVSFPFVVTDAWKRVCDSIDAESTNVGGSHVDEGLVDEVRIRGQFWTVHTQAIRRALVLRLAERDGAKVSGEAVLAATARFFRLNRLLTEREVVEWMTRNEVASGDLQELMEDEAHLLRSDAAFTAEVPQHVVNVLKVSDSFRDIRGRVEHKRDLLKALSISDPDYGDAGLPNDPTDGDKALCAWLGEELFSDAGRWRDAEEAAFALGFAGAIEFRRAALRERCYLRATSKV